MLLARPGIESVTPGGAGRVAASAWARSCSSLMYAVLAVAGDRRCVRAAWRHVGAGGPGALPGSGSDGASCATCGPRSSTTWPPACAPGCRCPRRSTQVGVARAGRAAPPVRAVRRGLPGDRPVLRLPRPAQGRARRPGRRPHRRVAADGPRRSAAATSAGCCAPCRRSCARTRAPGPSSRPARDGPSTRPGSRWPHRGSCSALLSLRPEAVEAYNTTAGLVVLAVGGGLCLVAYRVMVRIGRLPEEERVLAMTACSLAGAGVGLLAGCGLVARRQPGCPRCAGRALDDRLAPYLRDSAPPVAPAARGAAPSRRSRRSSGIVGAVRRRRVRGCSSGCWVGPASARHRLEQAGRGMTLEEFRAEQVVWGGGGLLRRAGRQPVLRRATASFRPVPLLLLCLSVAVAGVLAARPLAVPGGGAARGADDGGVPDHRRAAGPRRGGGRGPGRCAGAGHPDQPRRAGPRARPGAGRRPRRSLAGRRRCRASPAGPACRRWPGSSTASPSPSSAAPRWPMSCARRRSTSARRASGRCSKPAVARRSR